MSNHLVSIKMVEQCPASFMQSTVRIFNQGIFLKTNTRFEKVDIIGLASVEVTDKIENKQRLYTTKLVFKTLHDPDFHKEQSCYRLTSVTGKQYILGTKERPYTLFNSVGVIPNSPEDKTGCTCTVTYTNLFSLLSVLD